MDARPLAISRGAGGRRDRERDRRAPRRPQARALDLVRAPQLDGLGRSSTARLYGIKGRDEACAYAEDPILRARLLEALRVIRDQLVEKKLELSRLMGSELDAVKLVSCATLFEVIGRALGDDELEGACTAILDAAVRKGIPRCAFTLRETMRAS